ncbi:MAG: porin family protein, partial [bacterium]
MMRSLFLSSAAAFALLTGARAADLPVSPAPPPPPPMWTGFYAGMNAGYGFGGSQNVGTTAQPGIDNIASNPAFLTPFG